MYSRFFPDGLDGLPFAPRDLESAYRWAETRPGVHLRLTSDGISGVIEIYPPETSLPRWCLWQTSDRRLQLDDIAGSEFALPYPTIDMALRFIGANI